MDKPQNPITPHVAACAFDICDLIRIPPTSKLARLISKRVQECVEAEFDAAAEENERIPE